MSHCLDPLTIINPHWKKTSSKGLANLLAWRDLNYPSRYPDDYRITVPCGRCLGCYRDKSSSWRVRLIHEHRYGNHFSCICLTLTISDENLRFFSTPALCASSFRSFIDRLRYYVPGRKSPKRFFVSEYGERTSRLHYHGFIWDAPVTLQQLRLCWPYGFICVKPLRSVAQLAYAAKYVTKPPFHGHTPRVYVSPGLGRSYTEQSVYRSWHKSGNSDTNINYCVLLNGIPHPLPRYYSKKLFSDAEISRFKILLSSSDRPYRKVLCRKTYTDEQSYTQARQSMLQLTLRSGRSTLKSRKLKSL